MPLLTDLARRVERDLAQRIDRATLPENLREAIRYAALNGGKRLRPILTLLSCQAAGRPLEAAFPAGAALELVHCFSLVHDDLPAMDDDSLRRGRPTLHIHAGEAMAILAGDVMLSLAFEIIDQSELTEPQRCRLARELASATTAMIAGQVYDTLGGFDGDLTDDEKLLLTHRNKTGALIRGACRMGAICAGADEARMRALSTYGEAIGLMFQIVDDLLDVTQTAEHIGKATGKDLSAGKRTFPGLHGIEASRKEIARLEGEALEALASLDDDAGPLAELCRILAVRTR